MTNNNNTFDLGIIGMGVAGAFAATRLAQTNSSLKIIGFDMSAAPAKRKLQLLGFLGSLPGSDGKLYLNDIQELANLTGLRRAKSAFTQVKKMLEPNSDNLEVIKDQTISKSFTKKLNNHQYQIKYNNYIQLYPKDIHTLSKYMVKIFDEHPNLSFSYYNEVFNISKQKNYFHIQTEDGEFKCKKIIIGVGRSGWRWCQKLYSDFGIIESNDIARYGIKIEADANMMKDFNNSRCSLRKNDIEIGSLSWNGTVIPEDHFDLAISSFRSNEDRWKTDKVSFNFIGHKLFPNKGFEQTDRLAKLAFLLSNERIVKEKITTLINKKSKISSIPEYNWLIEALQDFALIVPEIISKGYFHIPTIIPMAPSINLGDNLASEVEGMYVVGESAGVSGILAAMMMGIIVADSINQVKSGRK